MNLSIPLQVLLKKGFWNRNKKLIGYSLAIATATTPVIYFIAGHAGNNPGLGYSIYKVSNIETQAYAMIPNPLLHLGIVLTRGYEIFGSHPAKLEGMIRDSAAIHLPYYWVGSSLINLLIGKGIGKLRNRQRVK